MSTRKWLRMSWWNAVLTFAVLVVAATMAAQGRWGATALLVIVAIVVGASAAYARSGRASDLTRLNAIEYADERDRFAATHALAIVGVVALVLAFAMLIVGAVLLEPGSPMSWIPVAQVVVLAVAWALANVVALRRR